MAPTYSVVTKCVYEVKVSPGDSYSDYVLRLIVSISHQRREPRLDTRFSETANFELNKIASLRNHRGSNSLLTHVRVKCPRGKGLRIPSVEKLLAQEFGLIQPHETSLVLNDGGPRACLLVIVQLTPGKIPCLAAGLVP